MTEHSLAVVKQKGGVMLAVRSPDSRAEGGINGGCDIAMEYDTALDVIRWMIEALSDDPRAVLTQLDARFK